ncbi:hypothetical protein D3C80_1933080 [compost metagenome]
MIDARAAGVIVDDALAFASDGRTRPVSRRRCRTATSGPADRLYSKMIARHRRVSFLGVEGFPPHTQTEFA